LVICLVIVIFRGLLLCILYIKMNRETNSLFGTYDVA
jgi:hypothetical protein